MTAEVIGVYQANGGLRGEVSYLLSSWLRGAHCSLCEITHGTLREKPEFQAGCAALPVPFRALHLNEQDAVLRQFTRGKTPCVVHRNDGQIRLLLSAEELDEFDGDVEEFFLALRNRLAP